MPPAIPNQLQDEKIAFVDDPGGDGLIAAVDPDGSGKERLMTVGTRVPPWPESLAISPDGHRVAFVGILRREDPTATTRDLYVIDSDGGNERRLTRNTTEELAVDWLPDGRIVFVSCPTTEYRDELPECDLVAMRPDGSDREELSKLRLTFDIDVSPDGRRIVYSQQEGQSHFQHFELHVANLDGSDHRQLTDDDTGDGSPAWSPDGTRIAFVSNRAESAPCFFHDCAGFANELYVMDADGSDVERVTETAEEEQTPAWSPDGEKIVYARAARGRLHQLFIVNADGSCPTPLTPGVTPDWYGPADSSAEPLDC